jgi:hypothetical protein
LYAVLWPKLKGQRMKYLDKLEIFNRWFNWHGHWIYANYDAAFKTWHTKGIENLPHPD